VGTRRPRSAIARSGSGFGRDWIRGSKFGVLRLSEKSDEDKPQMKIATIPLSRETSPRTNRVFTVVLGKFGLVQFRPFFPKLETELFGFSQNF